jgi:DNA-binding transcriptional LysR family regulator
MFDIIKTDIKRLNGFINMELRQIQYFVALYEERSVTRAARRLNIVQPALSMQMSKLEENWGLQLFIRNARGMSPTPVGDQMYKLFLPILADFHKAKGRLTQVSGVLTGHVRLGMIKSVSQNALVKTVLDFQQQHPLVTLSLHEGLTEVLAQSTAAGLLDAVVTNIPKRTVGLDVEVLLDEPLLLVVGANHHTLPSKVSIEVLETLNLVLPTQGHGLRRLIDQWAHDMGITLVPALEIDAMVAIGGVVSGGNYAALMPESVVSYVNRNQKLTVYKLDAPTFRRQVVCLTSATRPMSNPAQTFVTLLKRNIRGLDE